MKSIGRASVAIALIILSLIVIAGCSKVDVPTASQPTTEDGMGLWTPRTGDHVFPGDAIPMYRAGYVESQFGMAVNPLNVPNATLHIGPEGGVLHLGRHTLTVPAGAVTTDITFRIAWASLTAVAADCTPSGLTFNAPLTLTLCYAGTQYENMANPNLAIFYAQDDGSFERYPSVVDPVAKTVSAPLHHFSRYILSGTNE